MDGVSPVRDWLRAHPVTADVLVVLTALAIPALPYFDELRIELGGQRPTIVVVVLVFAALLLLLRRQRPWWVWAATTVLGLIGVVVAESPSPVFYPAVVALYTLSSRFPVRQIAIPAAVSALVPSAVLVAISSSRPTNDRAYEMVWWAVLAFVLGIAVRSQRALVEAANARTRAVEATREREARRRVTEERLRIARELHDVIAHHVAVISVQAGVARKLLRADPDGADQALFTVRESSQTVMREIPGMLGLLRRDGEPMDTAPAPGLDDALELVHQARSTGLQVVWHTSGTPRPLAPSVDLTAYRVIQEGLTNAQRHGTGEVQLNIVHDHSGLTIELRNRRADVAASPGSGHHGLVGMRERVSLVGGTLEAGPQDPHTWTLQAWLPLNVQVSYPTTDHTLGTTDEDADMKA